jgi:hypothetical protein
MLIAVSYCNNDSKLYNAITEHPNNDLKDKKNCFYLLMNANALIWYHKKINQIFPWKTIKLPILIGTPISFFAWKMPRLKQAKSKQQQFICEQFV